MPTFRLTIVRTSVNKFENVRGNSCTVKFKFEHVGWALYRDPHEQNDKHDLKNYLSATSLSGGNKRNCEVVLCV